ncbi:hypothetical protein [Paracraurococcus lichenis]|uniref:Uncharacterized protein n=1 Tax=Paracraurococcus lichenis TaxID=3064888 RepID=A0ABT9DWP8_9PROT|nr:hypothetical protein [Paracraurococcus sp. LOR1-02]MDO9708321.1 hypothetical protein [Paracraurococcus sp. LOR1-02]
MIPQPACPPRLAALRGPFAGLALMTLAACAPGGRDPAISSVPIAPGPAPRAALPTAPGQVYAAPAPAAGLRDQAAVASACRREADRIITFRDRGQLMREDERDSRLGSQASIFSQRAETDRLGRIYERDRLADQCVQENTRAAPQR